MLDFSFIDAVDTVKASLAPGEYLGQVRKENGKTYVRCLATATIAQYKACKIDVTGTTGTSVTPVTAATDQPVGVFEGATSATTSLPYFWLTTKAVTMTAAVQGTVTAGDGLSASGTAGALQTAPFTAATKQGVIAIALEANASGSANKAICLMSNYGGQ